MPRTGFSDSRQAKYVHRRNDDMHTNPEPSRAPAFDSPLPPIQSLVQSPVRLLQSLINLLAQYIS